MTNTASVLWQSVLIDHADHQETIEATSWRIDSVSVLHGSADGWTLTITARENGSFRLLCQQTDGALHVGDLSITCASALLAGQPRARSWALSHTRRAAQRALASASALAFRAEHTGEALNLIDTAQRLLRQLDALGTSSPTAPDPEPMCAA